MLRSAETPVQFFVLLRDGLPGRRLQLIIECQFFAAPNLTHRINKCLVIEHIYFAIWFAAMIDEAGVTALIRSIDNNALIQPESIDAGRLSFRDLCKIL